MGHEVVLRSVEENVFASDIESFRLLVLAFPSMLGASRWFSDKIEREFPKVDNKPAFVFNTRAIASWCANELFAAVLRKKGMTIIAKENFTARRMIGKCFLKKIILLSKDLCVFR